MVETEDRIPAVFMGSWRAFGIPRSVQTENRADNADDVRVRHDLICHSGDLNRVALGVEGNESDLAPVWLLVVFRDRQDGAIALHFSIEGARPTERSYESQGKRRTFITAHLITAADEDRTH
jgi:hypothetical protein